MLFIYLEDGEAVVIILHSSLTINLTFRIDGERQLGGTKLVPLRRKHFTEGVIAGDSMERGRIAVILGVSTQNNFFFGVPDFDQRSRQIIRAGNVHLCNVHTCVKQLVMNGVLQHDTDYIVHIHMIRRDADREVFLRKLPAIRRRKLFEVINAVRVHSGEGQLAICICDTHCNQ